MPVNRLHLVHTQLWGLANRRDPMYEELRAAYNPMRRAGSPPAPPLEEWQGMSSVCEHPYCRYERQVVPKFAYAYSDKVRTWCRNYKRATLRFRVERYPDCTPYGTEHVAIFRSDPAIFSFLQRYLCARSIRSAVTALRHRQEDKIVLRTSFTWPRRALSCELLDFSTLRSKSC